jgi:hypothetical protein
MSMAVKPPENERHAQPRSGPTYQRSRLRWPDYAVVKVAADLESTRLFEPADLHRFESGRCDQPLDSLASTVVVGRVEEDRRLR